MIPLPRLALAMAGAASLFAPISALANPAFAVGIDGLPESNVSRDGRYDPALIKIGTSAHAVSLCIRAAQHDMEARGKIMGIDVQKVEPVKGGFDVDGSVMVKQFTHNSIAKADFHCITQGQDVAKLTISRLYGDTA